MIDTSPAVADLLPTGAGIDLPGVLFGSGMITRRLPDAAGGVTAALLCGGAGRGNGVRVATFGFGGGAASQAGRARPHKADRPLPGELSLWRPARTKTRLRRRDSGM